MTQDHLGSPRVVSNQLGAVTDRKDYSAFGEEIVSPQRISSLGYTSAEELRKGYTGYEKDSESGLDFAQARYYNSVHGRYTSVDPLTASATIRNPQTFNRYSYVLNSPYKFTDPLGLLPESSTGGRCNFSCRVMKGINGEAKLSEADLDLAKFHIRNGSALGYVFLNASYAEINRRNERMSSSPTSVGSTGGSALLDNRITYIGNFIADGRIAPESILNTNLDFAYMLRSHADAFMKAVLAIEAKIGRKLLFNQFFRPGWYQSELREEYLVDTKNYDECWLRCGSKPFYTAPAGESTHELAASFDMPFSANKFTADEETFVMETFHKAGFVRDVSDEPHHFTTKTAAAIRAQDFPRLKEQIKIVQNKWLNARNP